VNSAEIRETFLSFFEERGHLRVPSSSLVPAAADTSTLLTVAGMQQFKPYFEGREQPPSPRLTTCQRTFRTVDIDVVGSTKRHLTFFEMLGNFSVGDYFKREAQQFGWELSTEGFNFDPDLIWVTVFEGSEEIGLGPDTESIDIWREIGLPEERILMLPASENFWQAGPTGPCGPCSEMYIDRGEAFGGADDRPGDDTDRFLEYWNHVFMTYMLHEDGSLTPLPQRNIDTGLGLERMAVIQQEVDSVFDTDLFQPLIGLAEDLSGKPYGSDEVVTRAMRIIADHSRGTVNLIADGVVPSNEDRGYVLRRIMRRAIHQGRVLGLESPYMPRFAERAIETLGDAYPDLEADRENILRWVEDEEESFGRTLERGTEMLAQLVATAKEQGATGVPAADVFKLHDTYGFPYDLTRELVAEEGLEVDDAGFEALMEKQRSRARSAATGAGSNGREGVEEFVTSAPRTNFVGYETLRSETSVVGAQPVEGNGEALIKLEESPFYPEGGGQVSDSGVVRAGEVELQVVDVYRVGDDQVVKLALPTADPDGGGREAEQPAGIGSVVEAEVDHEARYATMRNHTATHLLHAALRERLGSHVRQAGSAVRPDKLRFDFNHSSGLSSEELRDIEDRVNDWIKASRPVRALEMSRPEAEALGAMALFGEKYGDWVRVIEIDGVSRELCGGTHVANTAEIGIFVVVSEGSSAANVRRIEALTGPAAIDWFQARRNELEEAARLLGTGDVVTGARRLNERLAELERTTAEAARREAGEEAEGLAEAASEIGGVKVVVARSALGEQAPLLALARRIAAKLGEAAVVLGGTGGDKVALVGMFTPAAVGRGISAADVIREAAEVVGGGGGGKEDVAQAGGREPARLDEALDAARAAIERGLGS
jgi:alanyl-tRNA synthetase